MERSRNARRNYNDTHDDPALRLSKRPSQTRLYGDDAMSAPSKFSQSSKPKRSATVIISEDDEDMSDDPLDSLSEASPKKAKKSDKYQYASQPKDYAKKDAVLKGLKFKKNKTSDKPGGLVKEKSVDQVKKGQSKSSSNDKDIYASPPSPPPPRRRPPKKIPAPAPFPLATGSSSSSLPMPHHSDNDDDSDRPKARPFPVPSPPRSSSVTPPSERGARKRGPAKPKGFPMDLGPETTKKPRKPQAFPMLVEPSVPRKSSRRVIHSESSSDSDGDLSPPNPPKKRISSGDGPSPRKKTRPGDTSLIDEHAPVEESFFDTVDPSTLCPYCDNPLPASPSPALRALLEVMAKKSYPDPRPTNVLGRKAPFSTFISVCQRHRFETDILPEAKSKGWPNVIDWKKLAGRIEKMKPKLQLLIDDDSDDGPRARSAAWNEIMELVKEKGSRAATGVKDQFLNFEKTQPGYYGELGSVIIHQTLYDLFPPASIDVETISPLGAEEFLQRVLIPEVALRLVIEDQHLRGSSGRRQALQILRDSSVYGVAMFPAEQSAEGKNASSKSGASSSAGGSGLSGNTKEGLNAGETIVMERARKRRKEIEEEEAREKEEEESGMKVGSYPTGTADRPKPRPKPVVKGSRTGSLMDVDVNAMPSSKSDAESGRDAMRYDTESADGLSGSEAGRRKGKGKQVASLLSPKPRSSNRSKSTKSHPLFTDSSDSAIDDSDTMGKKRMKAAKPAPFPLARDRQERAAKKSNPSPPESNLIEIESEEEFLTKTPKARPFPLALTPDNAPTPRPSQGKPKPAPSRSTSTSESLPPLLRARALAQANGKATATATATSRTHTKAPRVHRDSPTQNGGGTWLHSMLEGYTRSGDDSDSSMNSTGSVGYHRKQVSKAAGKAKATTASGSLGKSKETKSRVGEDDGDNPTNWLFSPTPSQESAQNGKARASQSSRRKG